MQIAPILTPLMRLFFRLNTSLAILFEFCRGNSFLVHFNLQKHFYRGSYVSSLYTNLIIRFNWLNGAVAVSSGHSISFYSFPRTFECPLKRDTNQLSSESAVIVFTYNCKRPLTLLSCQYTFCLFCFQLNWSLSSSAAAQSCYLIVRRFRVLP